MEALSEPLLVLEWAEPTTVVSSVAGGDFVAFSSACPGHDGPNEDAAAVFPGAGTTVLAVADGLGGGRSGHLAARLAVEALGKQLVDLPSDARSPILDAIESANEAIRALGVGAATTLAAVELRGQTLRPYHVGDSTILVLGGRGKVKFVSVSHSPVGYGVEAGLIDSEAALHHEELNIVSNTLGSADMRIELGAPLELAARDTVILGTDGLFDNVHVAEIFDLVKSRELADAARALAEFAIARMLAADSEQPSKPDDITFVIYRPQTG
jgi:serine/threonine protein phosphatase PrpC